MDIYAQNILDRYKKPFYKTLLEDPTVHHKEANHSCGDITEISIQLQNDKVTSYGFEGNGCAISMAAADMMGSLIEDMTVDEVLGITKDDIYEMLGIEISVRRSKCALLALLALQNGLLENEGRNSISWSSYHL